MTPDEEERMQGSVAKRRMFALGAVGVLVHVLGFLLFEPRIVFPGGAGAPVAGPQPGDYPAAAMSLVHPESPIVSQILGEQSEMFDSTPLFYSRKENFGHNFRPAFLAQRNDEALFSPFPAAPLAGDPGSLLPVPNEGPGWDLDGVSESIPFNYFDSFGERDTGFPQLAERQAYLQVRRLDNGPAGTTDQVLQEDELPPQLVSRLAKVNQATPWSPAAFLLTVSPTGLVGQPFQVASSGDAALDQSLQDWVSSPAFVRRFLAVPGYYRVNFGP